MRKRVTACELPLRHRRQLSRRRGRLLRLMDGYHTFPGTDRRLFPGAGPEDEGRTPKRRV